MESTQRMAAGQSHFDWARPLTEVVLLGNVGLRLQLREELTTKKLLWDGAICILQISMRRINSLKTEYRQGWTL